MTAGVQKPKIRWVIILFLVLYFYGMPVQAQYGGGSGTPEDPYLIYTAEQLNEIGLHEDDWDKHFKLMGNVDLLDFDGKQGRPPFNMIAPDTNMTKIGFQGTPFTGVFDGNGHTISNFIYNNTERDYIGLFGCVEKENGEENVEIKNLGLIDPNVDAGTANYVGSLVGRLRRGTITNCYVEGGSVSGDHCVGGIAGDSSGTIINCYANGSVMGSGSVGGMVGYNSRTITNCYASSVVIGNTTVGGMVAYNYDGRIINCCANSVVIGNTNVGGMVGSNGIYVITVSSWWPHLKQRTAKISNCYSTSDVSGDDRVGGLAGEQAINNTITNCYSTGSVSGNADVGGLVGAIAPPIVIAPPHLIVPDLWGFTPDTISDFYSTADITRNGGDGQIVWGVMIPDVNSFWDTESSGQHTSVRGIGKTTAEMQTASTFLEAGWDFVGENVNGAEDIWWILEGQDYPRLIWELPEGLRLQPLPVFCPDPRDGATDVTQSPILHWAPAEPTLQHDIYLGDDKEEVANATTLSLGIYRGRQPGELTTYEPGKLEWDATYYWRIDEVNEAEPNNLCKGSVWSFTTANFLIVDDFESYNILDPADPNSNSIFNTWIAVLETTTIGLAFRNFPFSFPMDSGNIQFSHTQVMNYNYDNSGRVHYSEATANITYLAIGQDWTIEGDGVLSLWFRGTAYNAPEPMYVGVANTRGPTAVVYHDNPDAATTNTPMEWTIDLQLFADQGVDLANVNKISIGFGDRNNPQPGGSGGVHFDDIRLYRSRPEPEPAPEAP